MSPGWCYSHGEDGGRGIGKELGRGGGDQHSMVEALVEPQVWETKTERKKNGSVCVGGAENRQTGCGKTLRASVWATGGNETEHLGWAGLLEK